MPSSDHITINIDSNTIFRVLLITVAAVFLYYIRDVIVTAFVAFIIVSAITPVIDYLEKFYLPRTLVVLIIYLLIISGFIYLLSLLIPAIGEQLQQLSTNLPSSSQKITHFADRFKFFKNSQELFREEKRSILMQIGNRFSESWWNIFTQAGSLLRSIFSAIAIISLSFYLNIQKKSVGTFFQSFIPVRHQEYAVVLMEKIQQKIGYWMLGQITLNIIIGILVYIGLTVIGIPYALLLSLLAATFEVIPYIGPIASAIPGILIALSIGPLQGLLVLLMYIIIQQAENHLLVPLVMKRAVGLNPVAVIIAILIGLKIAGPLGAILAIPISAAISVFLSDFIQTKPSVKSKA